MPIGEDQLGDGLEVSPIEAGTGMPEEGGGEEEISAGEGGSGRCLVRLPAMPIGEDQSGRGQTLSPIEAGSGMPGGSGETAPLPTASQEARSSDDSSSPDPLFSDDIMEVWAAIEREEAQIWRDLNQTPLTPEHQRTSPEDDDSGPSLGFFVVKTRYGKVYHIDKNCVHLQNPRIREAREYHWCKMCARVAMDTRGRPPPGVNLLLSVTGTEAHTDERCPRLGNSVRIRICADCLRGEENEAA